MRYFSSLTAFALLIVFTTLSLSSCGDDDISDGPNNTADVAVTGKVSEIGSNYAVINGVVNLDKITAAYNSIEFGVEVSTIDDFSNSRRVSVYSLVGRALSVKVTGLQQNTKYYYRTYVHPASLSFVYYGSVSSFTTTAIAPSDDNGMDNGHA